jgi:hypothetical protein
MPAGPLNDPDHAASAVTTVDDILTRRLDRETLIDEVVERLRREARGDRERLGFVLEDLL